MEFITASEVAAYSGENPADVRRRLAIAVKNKSLIGYVLVPMGKTLEDPSNIIVFKAQG